MSNLCVYWTGVCHLSAEAFFCVYECSIQSIQFLSRNPVLSEAYSNPFPCSWMLTYPVNCEYNSNKLCSLDISLRTKTFSNNLTFFPVSIGCNMIAFKPRYNYFMPWLWTFGTFHCIPIFYFIPNEVVPSWFDVSLCNFISFK